jgi:hypothetical protein
MTVEYRPVTVGATVGNETVIQKGVQPGENVVTDGQLRLSDGAHVRIAPAGSTSTTPEVRSREARKSEIRSTKSETNSNDRNPKFKTGGPPPLALRSFELWILDLFRISNFEIRISGREAGP